MDERFVNLPIHNQQPAHTAVRFVLTPGCEFDPSRKYKYGLTSLAAAILILVSFILVEMRDCNAGPGIDLDKLQALHLTLMVFAFVLYLLSLFGMADYIFQFKFMFLLGVLTVYVFAGLMVWMTYEAAVNPCVKTVQFAPIDFTPTFGQSKNVFGRGDAVGIIVLLLDIFATIFMISAATSFYKRY